MDHFVDENDKYIFSVLGRITGGKWDLLLTDHRFCPLRPICLPMTVRT